MKIDGKQSELKKDVKGIWRLYLNNKPYLLKRIDGDSYLPDLTRRKHWAINLIRKYWENVI